MFLGSGGIAYIFSLVFLFVSCASVASNVNNCDYCGEWQPAGRSMPGPLSGGEKIIINDSSLTLPGCKDTHIIKRYFRKGDKVIFGGGKESDLNQLVVVFELEANPECRKPIAAVSEGTLVEIELTPRFWENSEELMVTLLPREALDELLKYYSSELQAIPSIAKNPKPEQIVYWWAIRSGYNPCDEGTPNGSYLCAQAEFYVADGKLNDAWGKLLKSTSSNKFRKGLVARQKAWLVATNKSCLESASPEEWHWKMAEALQIMCSAEKYSERADEFLALEACLRSGNTNCTLLSKE